jgi:hypothetical protein
MKLIACLFIFAGLAACATTDDSLRHESAASIGGSVTPAAVTVTNVARGMSSVTWSATASKKVYDCAADDMLRRVRCVARD